MGERAEGVGEWDRGGGGGRGGMGGVGGCGWGGGEWRMGMLGTGIGGEG